jgi:hypothetical protein
LASSDEAAFRAAIDKSLIRHYAVIERLTANGSKVVFFIDHTSCD